jgi:hypothetical protein
MPIRTFYNFVGLHVGLERLKNKFEASMVKLAAKQLEFSTLSLAFACYINERSETRGQK